MTMPNWQDVGASSETVGGAGDTTPAWPTHLTGDVGIVSSESDVAAPTMPYTELDVSAITITGAAVLGLSYKRAASGGEGAPTIPDPGNHCFAVINTFRNVHQRYPFHQQIGINVAASTTPQWPAFETKVDDCLIALYMTWNIDNAGPLFSAPANASLANVTERHDAGTVDAGGGGIVLVTGEKAAAGPVDLTTGGMSSSAGGVTAILALAPIADIPITVAVEVDGVPHASGDGVVFLYDTSQPAANYLVLDAATETTEYVDGLDGSGEADFVVPYNDHIYVAFYTDDSGGLSGVSGPITYSGGFPTATISISTGGGGGADPQLLYTKARGLSLGGH